MCHECSTALSRRKFFQSAATGLLAAGAVSAGLVSPSLAKTELTPDEALQKLKDGNQKFVAAPELCEADMLATRATVAKGQSPWATVLTCADSRLSPELLFGGMSLGELFVCRNAGNQADDNVLGSIEYGAEHLGSPLIVVLGHERCGAVAAACDLVDKGGEAEGYIGKMLHEIIPVAESQHGKDGDYVDNTVIENARVNAEKIATLSPIVAELVKEGKVKVVYGRYDLDSGEVTFLG
jgi:carbonic anhydrase